MRNRSEKDLERDFDLERVVTYLTEFVDTYDRYHRGFPSHLTSWDNSIRDCQWRVEEFTAKEELCVSRLSMSSRRDIVARIQVLVRTGSGYAQVAEPSTVVGRFILRILSRHTGMPLP
jgi:hypothetical protein